MKEAFEKIKERLDNASYMTEPIFDEDGYVIDDSVEEVVTLDKAIEIVNQVAEEYSSSEIPNKSDGWIPCSEKTPEFEIYSVTRLWVTMHRKGCGFYFVRTLRWNGYQGRWEWDNGKTLSDAYEVVAWREMVVPAPYQPKGE